MYHAADLYNRTTARILKRKLSHEKPFDNVPDNAQVQSFVGTVYVYIFIKHNARQSWEVFTRWAKIFDLAMDYFYLPLTHQAYR